MKLEYKYGQTYFTDLHIGDIIPTCGGEYIIISAEDIFDLIQAGLVEKVKGR